MDYEHLKKAIKLLTNATQDLEYIVREATTNKVNNQTIETAKETLKKSYGRNVCCGESSSYKSYS